MLSWHATSSFMPCSGLNQILQPPHLLLPHLQLQLQCLPLLLLLLPHLQLELQILLLCLPQLLLLQ